MCVCVCVACRKVTLAEVGRKDQRRAGIDTVCDFGHIYLLAFIFSSIKKGN